MLQALRKAIFVLIAVALPFISQATHLMGGSLTYAYLGQDAGGNYQYRVTLTIYRYCAAGSAQLPTAMTLGVYQDNPGNPTGNKNRVLQTSLPLITQQNIVPPTANANCTFTANVCVEEGVYQTVLTLPDNPSGYYLIADRCCRNNNIDNLFDPGNTGQAYYASMPAPSSINSSPTFATAPVPYLCAGDTFSILNQALDTDGDLLTYQFVTPYQGISSSNQPNPTAPLVYPWPIQEVTYATNYSLAQPFGAGGSAVIDTATGLASYFAPAQGFYVIAVEVSEYRNGVLIGVTRRDLQIIVIPCPINPAPALATGSTQTTYNIQEGQTLCFNIQMTDANGDSIFFTHTGNIFNSSLTNPAATLTDTSGPTPIQSQFCWTTSCSQGRTTPYQFSISAADNGCPAKTTNIVYTINVQNTITPTAINGPDTLCANAASGVTYSVAGTSGYTYNWQVIQGTQVTGGTSANIGVNFPALGNATIRVVGVNPFGCPSDTVTKQVFIKPQPTAVAGSDQSYCSGASVTIGSSTTGGVSYAWTPSAGLSSATSSNPTVTLVNTGTIPTVNTFILTTTANGCTNKYTVAVTVNPLPVANAGTNTSFCSGAQITLGTSTTSGFTYVWSPAGGLNNTGISNPVLTLTNTDTVPDTLNYFLITTNQFTCRDSDTVQVTVAPIPLVTAGSDVIFCSGQTVAIGTLSQFGFTYAWSPSTGVTPATNSAANLTLTNTTTVFDTVNLVLAATRFGCTGRDTIEAIVKPRPIAEAGTSIIACQNDTATIGAASLAGYSYSWSPATNLSSTNASNPNVFINTSSTPTTTTYTVTVTANGCVNTDSVSVTSNPLPNVAAVTNATVVCLGTGATLTASGASTYSWENINTPLTVIGTGASLNVTPTVSSSYVVTGTSAAGCKNKDTVSVTVAPLPSVAITSAGDSICAGDTIQLSANGAVNYNWTLLGSSTSISTQNSIFVSPAAITSYVLTGTDANLCANKDTITVHVNPAATAASILGNTSVCTGVTGVSYWVPGANQNSTYDWSISNGAILSGQGNDSVFTSWDSSAIGILYVVETTDRGCKSDSIALPVNVNEILTPPAPLGTSNYCSDQAIGVTYTTPSTPGSVYTWFIQGGNVVSGNGTNSVIVDWAIAGQGTGAIWYEEQSTTIDTVCFGVSDTLFVNINPSPQTSAISGIATLCFGDTVVFNVTNTGGSSYAWTSTNSTILNGGTSNASTVIMNVGSGAATVTVVETNTFGCIGQAVNLPLTINPLPNANAGSNAAICLGDSINLTATGGTSYAWTPANSLNNANINNPLAFPTSTTNYSVLVTDNNNCKKTAQVTITVNQLPVITAGNAVAICLDKSTTLNAGGGSTYVWTPSTGLSDPNSSSPVASPITTTVYTVTGTDANNCSSTASVQVTVNPLPTAIASTDTSICDQSTISLSAGGGQTYSWTPATGLNNPNISNPDATPSVTTTYTVTATDANGCTDTEDVVVSVNAQPKSDFDLMPDSTIASCAGIRITLQNNSTNASDYKWYLGGVGNVSTDFEPSGTYPFGGYPTITLISINNFCSDTLRKDFQLGTVGDYLDNLPNAFSPNNDGINDCFDLGKSNEFYGCSNWTIINRWGEVIYKSKSDTDCWNGKRDGDGADMPEGTYFYIIKIFDSTRQGALLLSR
jgi:gliding motility-associated-like protein